MSASIRKLDSARELAIFAGVAPLAMLASQASSYLVDARLALNQTYVLNTFIHFTHTRNFGTSFGLLHGMGWLISASSAALLCGIVVYLTLKEDAKRHEYVCFGFIVGAGASNILDRVIYGGVVDFIDIQHIPYWHYIFNTADVMIHVGIWPIVLFALLRK